MWLRRAQRSELPESSISVQLGVQSPHRSMLQETRKRRWRWSDTRTDAVPVKKSFSNTILRDEGNRIRATIVVDSIETCATIDSGASASFISQQVASQINRDCQRIPIDTHVTLADGSTQALREAVVTPVRLGNSLVRTTFVVMPKTSDNVVLGLDFLRAAGATLCFGGGTLVMSIEEESKITRNCVHTGCDNSDPMPLIGLPKVTTSRSSSSYISSYSTSDSAEPSEVPKFRPSRAAPIKTESVIDDVSAEANREMGAENHESITGDPLPKGPWRGLDGQPFDATIHQDIEEILGDAWRRRREKRRRSFCRSVQDRLLSFLVCRSGYVRVKELPPRE